MDLVKTATFQGLELFNFIDSKTCFKLSLFWVFSYPQYHPPCCFPGLAVLLFSFQLPGVHPPPFLPRHRWRKVHWVSHWPARRMSGEPRSCKWADAGEFLGIEGPDILITCIIFFSGDLYCFSKIYTMVITMKSPRDKDFCCFFSPSNWRHWSLHPDATTLNLTKSAEDRLPKTNISPPRWEDDSEDFPIRFLGLQFFFCWCHDFVFQEGIWLQPFGGSILLFLGWKTVGVGGAMIFYWMKSWSLKRVVFSFIFSMANGDFGRHFEFSRTLHTHRFQIYPTPQRIGWFQFRVLYRFFCSSAPVTGWKTFWASLVLLRWFTTTWGWKDQAPKTCERIWRRTWPKKTWCQCGLGWEWIFKNTASPNQKKRPKECQNGGWKDYI